MTAKIVYYGPGLCGKTTNLLIIFDKLDPKSRGKMLSLATKTDRTLFFDLLPVDIGKVGAFNLRIQLYTVPGQVFYNETRKLVLKGADAVVFVADSQPSMLESNRESFQNLLENLEQNQIDPNEIPVIVQFNKRDIPGVLEVEEIQEKLGLEGYPYTEAAAIKGEGVMETFKLASKITAKHLINKLQGKPTAALKEPPKAKAAKKDKKHEKHERHDKHQDKRSARHEPPPAAEPDPDLQPLEMNPFGDPMGAVSGTMGAPFPEAEPFEDPGKEYEKIEEVSLEKLLEGRERPLTLSGNYPNPLHHVEEEVEHLGTEELIDHHGAVSIAVEEEQPIPFAPSKMNKTFADESGADLREEIKSLRQELADVRRKYDELLNGITRISGELTRLAQK